MNIKFFIDFFNPYKEASHLSESIDNDVKKKAWAEGALWMFCYLVECIRNKKKKKRRNMKQEELMMDDYITVAHSHRQPTIEQVYGLNKNAVLVKNKEGLIYLFEYSRISPVPLSEEIFLKSGFVKTGTDEVCYRYSKGTCDFFSRVEIRPQDEGWFVLAQNFSMCEIPYDREFKGRILFLHELQHILRLIGIEKEVKI